MRSEGNAVQLRTGNATCKCGGHQLRLKDQIWESEPTTAEETKEHKQQEKLRTFWKLRQEGEKMTSTITFLHCIMHLTYFLLRFEWEIPLLVRANTQKWALWGWELRVTSQFHQLNSLLPDPWRGNEVCLKFPKPQEDELQLPH